MKAHSRFMMKVSYNTLQKLTMRDKGCQGLTNDEITQCLDKVDAAQGWYAKHSKVARALLSSCKIFLPASQHRAAHFAASD